MCRVLHRLDAFSTQCSQPHSGQPHLALTVPQLGTSSSFARWKAFLGACDCLSTSSSCACMQHPLAVAHRSLTRRPRSQFSEHGTSSRASLGPTLRTSQWSSPEYVP